MAKQIVILETNPADGGFNTIRAVFWFAVPVNRRVPVPNAQSLWTGASAGEVADLQSGAVLEERHDIRVPSSFTVAEQKNALNKAYTDRLTFLGAQPFKLQFAGVFFDSATGWSA